MLLVLFEPAEAAKGGRSSERGKKADTQKDKGVSDDFTPPGWEKGGKKGWGEGDIPPGLRRKQLEEVRRKNPEKFDQIMRKRLRQLKKDNPKRHKQIMKRRRQARERRKYLQRLRKEDPEKFRQVTRERLRRLKKENPKKYKQIMKRRRARKRERPKGPDDIPPGWERGEKEGWDEGATGEDDLDEGTAGEVPRETGPDTGRVTVPLLYPIHHHWPCASRIRSGQ